MLILQFDIKYILKRTFNFMDEVAFKLLYTY